MGDITGASYLPSASYGLQMKVNVFGWQTGASVFWMKVISLLQVSQGPEIVKVINKLSSCSDANGQ